ncbi:acylneuraminate cytidylyltransferase family protein [Lysinibacillus mangiferihumi]|uniref:Acylneuraminate cytidylyltransferase family protein n=1 Tax=Lysinibacillus mangiferihumi TaxID=1130819 RepID=A0A4U2ZEI5_9BACI|nr:acylneuraminate cytidylyltransferase family protein [Lysinibacillus mangiferihumi]TKI72838.1 acylneuraminate cytidylyltransferase family protein [Lysinibacillus mangiferihumi]
MNLKILAIIPARGGSKGVPRKNIRNLAGKPLIAWTIEEAKKSKYINRLVLSSDDDEIIEVAKEYGCDVPFKRPKELAQDDTPGIETVLHAIEHCPGYDFVMILQPTSPLRTVEDIDQCIEYTMRENAKLCVSVSEASQSPYWMYKREDDYLVPLIKQDKLITRRQDIPKVFILNGSIYLGDIEKIKAAKSFITNETKAYEMPISKSYDIDSLDDFIICENFIKKLP